MATPFEAELLQHAEALRALAQVLVGDQHADDLVQDVALQAMQNPPPVAAGLRGWLATVLRRQASNRRRGEARRRRRHEVLALRGPRDTEDPAHIAAQQEIVRTMMAALFALPEACKDALFRRFFQGMTPTAIAAATGEPLATVKSRLQRGLAMLRERLDGECPGAWRPALCAALGLDDAGLVLTPTAAVGGLVVMGIGTKLFAATLAILATVMLWPRGADPTPPTAHVAATGGPAPGAASTAEGPSAQRTAAANTRVPDAAGAAAGTSVLAGRCIDEFGRPLAAVVVTLTSRLADDERVAAWTRRHAELPPMQRCEVTTGADGCFRIGFEAWAPLRFWLRVARTDLVPMTGHFPSVERGHVIELGDIRLARGTRFHGRVVDRAGAPQAGLDVTLDRYGGFDGSVAAITDTTFRTNDDGTFVADEALPPGRYLVLLGRRHNPTPDEVTVGAPTDDAALELVVDTCRAPMRLDGTVVDTTGAPIAGVAVLRQHGIDARFLRCTTTDADGRFHLGRQPGDPDALLLQFEHPEFEPAAPPTPFVFGADDVRIALEEGVPVLVTVVQDPTAQPVADYQLRIVRIAAGLAAETRVTAAGHHPGGITGLRLRRGRYWLFAEPRADGFATSAPAIVAVTGAPQRIVLQAARESPVVVRVQDAAGNAVPHATVALVDAMGLDLRAHTPRQRPQGTGWHADAAAILLDEARTDRDGRAVLQAPARHGLTLTVDGDDLLFTQVPFAMDPQPEIVVTVQMGARLRGELTPPSALVHYRTLAGLPPQGSGEPTAPRVVLVPSGPDLAAAHALPRTAALTADGRFEFGGLLPGTWTCRLQFAWNHDGNPIELDRELGAVAVAGNGDQSVRLHLETEEPGRLRARILHNGEPVRRRLIEVSCSVPRTGGEAMQFDLDITTDADGAIDLPVLPGRYAVVDWGNHVERMLLSEEVATVAPGQALATVFQLWSGTLRLTLRTADGKPARGVTPFVWNRTAREHYVHNRGTDEHGVVVLELTRGDYDVQLGDLGEQGTTIGTVTITPGQATDVVLRMPR
jgi:RNA polymerase sigma-70 factor (ECF subfamily)